MVQFLFVETLTCSPGVPHTCSIAEGNHEFLTFLPLPPDLDGAEGWTQAFMVLGKHSAKQATSPALPGF